MLAQSAPVDWKAKAMHSLITGATGFVGRRLLKHLDRPVVLSRNAAKAVNDLAAFHITSYQWDPAKEPAPAKAFDGVQAVFHLAGDPVAEGRWTAAKKARLRESRIAGTKNLVKTLSELTTRPKVLVSASAVGYYSDRGEEILDESAAPRDDFLGELCQAWEREASEAEQLGIRVVSVRVGIVLGEKGGALAKMLPPFYLGLGAPLGSGRQYMPWIHIEDLVRLMIFAAENENVRGPVNGVGPTPVTNREFTKTLGRVLSRPTIFPPVPRFMLNVMFGEFGQILLHSQQVVPKNAVDAGFVFQFSELEPALRDILKK
jgi:uncharacterized protein (TIGR01777 family)